MRTGETTPWATEVEPLGQLAFKSAESRAASYRRV